MKTHEKFVLYPTKNHNYNNKRTLLTGPHYTRKMSHENSLYVQPARQTVHDIIRQSITIPPELPGSALSVPHRCALLAAINTSSY